MAKLTTAALYCLMLFLSGCSFNDKQPATVEKKPGMENKFIVITASKGMNNSSALTVDVVQVYEEYIWNELVDLPAPDYFKKRDTVMKKNANVWTIDVVEDFWAKSFVLRGYQDKCIGTILFTTYPGDINKVKLKSGYDSTVLRLGVNGITKAESATFTVEDSTEVHPR